MKYCYLYRLGADCFQGNIRSEREFKEWMNRAKDVKWAALFEAETGAHILTIHNAILKVQS